MTGPIIVGYDGRDEARDALALARLLATLDAPRRLIVVSVLGYAPTEVEAIGATGWVEEEGARLADEARSALAGAAAVETLTITTHSPARAIHDAAESRDAELIVIGSTHRGALGAVLLGSTGERLLAAAPCAVAVAPRGYAGQGPVALDQIGVGYDVSRESKQALARAIELTSAAGGTMRVLSVVDPADLISVGWGGIAPLRAYPAADLEARHAELQRHVAEALDRAPTELPATSEILEGDAADALIAASKELDLLVIGSRGYGPLRRVLLGGVSARVIRKAACPVLVVPRAGPAPAEHVQADDDRAVEPVIPRKE